MRSEYAANLALQEVPADAHAAAYTADVHAGAVVRSAPATAAVVAPAAWQRPAPRRHVVRRSWWRRLLGL